MKKENKVITIEEFKVENTRLLQSMLTLDGGLNPIVTGLVINPDGKYVITVMPLPQEAFASDENKKRIPKIIPILFEKLKEDGVIPICFSFTSEAWLRMLDKNEKMPDDWKSLPSKEAFISTYETAEGVELQVNLIHREGKIANKKGELIDAIRLERVSDMETGPKSSCGGTLMNMFHKELKKLKEEQDGKSKD